MLRIVRLISLGLICLLAGFYASAWYRAQQESAGQTPSPTSASVELVERLPDFQLADLDGERRSIREWSDRNLLINFWATWCAPCRREMPLLQTVFEERADRNFTVIGIAIDRQPDVETFIAESGVTYPILVGQQDAIEAAETFGPEFAGLPFSIVVAAGGEILALYTGELHRDQLRRMLAVIGQLDAGRLSVATARRRLASH